MENLNKQVFIYSLDTSSFDNETEHNIDQELIAMRNYINQINKILKSLKKNDSHELSKVQVRKVERIINESPVFDKLIGELLIPDGDAKRLNLNEKSTLQKLIKFLNSRKNELKKKLNAETEKHEGIRTLRNDALKESNLISQFDSTLTRTLKIEKDAVSTDIIVVRAYRYSIFKSLVENGFNNENEEHFEYLMSSAGGIRNKKSFFVKSDTWKKIKNAITCGLDRDKINKKGGMNINKYNVYLSLCSSASVEWDLDIDRCVVVDDFLTDVHGTVDYIDLQTYEIETKEMDIPINHVDGAGMILPSLSDKSFQFRMPYFKGLLIPFDWNKFINKLGGKQVITDIYGQEYDIKDLDVIFTKSQFKAWVYFDSWDEYKNNFKKYKCQVAKCREEEDEFNDKLLNYQMLQTLHNMDRVYLEYFAKSVSNEIKIIGESKDAMLRILGADDSNDNKYGFQKAVSLYPNLLNDAYSKDQIKKNRLSLIEDAKAGKLMIEGTKRTYISPDLFAFAEWLFLGIKKPDGLLKNGKVSCRLYGEQKLDVLRSPHLYIEHCVRENVRNEDTNEWFITNDIYTSTHDLISKQLMFDVDGDDSTIVSDPRFIEIAEKHMEGIYPLEYKLGTAEKDLVTNDKIYKSLIAAYSKNIGEISNDITKLFNKEEFTDDDLKIAKWLVFENNAIIDFAKTLWMPTRPREVNKTIREQTKVKLPHFFIYAKDKNEDQVNEMNDSVINMLDDIIPDNRIHFKRVVGELDYRMLMKNKNRQINMDVISLYENFNKNKHNEVKKQVKKMSDKKRKKVELFVYKQFRNKLLEVDKLDVVVDSLVKYLFTKKENNTKQTLWYCFGDEIAKNISFNVNGIKYCEELGCWVEIESTQAKKYCSDCAAERERKRKRGSKKNKKVAKIK